MIAVDTNLLVRLMTEDDPGQARRATKIMESDEIFIPKTPQSLRQSAEADKSEEQLGGLLNVPLRVIP